MSFDFLTEHQIHILQRIAAAGGMFLLLSATLVFLSRRSAARRKAADGKKRGEPMEILPTHGWRSKPKRKKGRR